MDKLNTLLNELREKENLSFTDLEESTGISATYLWLLETKANKIPSPRILNTLANFYNVDYTIFINAIKER
ncbi:helix-turn-helix domain-containing protein [Clostridium sp. 'White wine YQ']|uniref:helix-turn-helix domain-containing protein n=1 Tax=Clostridium sp. 'White wine YQ' TaxID=3027474 RepID=UPI002365D8CA|nr:helix-turn-helix transcriptional regulator [Clostridium sp. 'White wine YQ']MDD7794239.1 helix-turn-helix transcriptional regulator [Clostridium sp. 'White wine YQ']